VPSSHGEGAPKGRAPRLPDNEFEPSERLFRRFSPLSYSEGELAVDAIRFPDMSVNREKYSKPEQVLEPAWPTWGILAFEVEEVPSPICSDDGDTYEFRVQHVPTWDNDAHSEVRCYHGDQHVSKGKRIPATVKQQFRMLLLRAIVILRKPKRLTVTGN
jgi:hypothetical protein